MSKRSRPVREEGAIEGSPEKSKLAPAPSPAAPPAQPLTRGTPPTLYLDEEASDDGFDDGVDAAEAAPTDKEERAFVGSEATPVLSGEVVRHADGTWTFAFDRPAAMGWPVLAAALELADGTALEGELTSMHETTANTEGVRRTEVVFTPTQDREGEAHALRITIDGRAYTVVFSSSAPTP